MLPRNSSGVTEQANAGRSRVLVKRMVIGWLLSKTQASEERKPMVNTLVRMPFSAMSVARAEAKMRSQPVTLSASTMMNL